MSAARRATRPWVARPSPERPYRETPSPTAPLPAAGGRTVDAGDIAALAGWDGGHSAANADREIAFAPARILLQDFTGVPAIVDLAAMRDAMDQLGGNSAKVNPLVPAELVIDHSVIVDEF